MFLCSSPKAFSWAGRFGFVFIYIQSSTCPSTSLQQLTGHFPTFYKEMYLSYVNTSLLSLVLTHCRTWDACIHLLGAASLVCGHFLPTHVLTSFKVQYARHGKRSRPPFGFETVRFHIIKAELQRPYSPAYVETANIPDATWNHCATIKQNGTHCLHLTSKKHNSGGGCWWFFNPRQTTSGNIRWQPFVSAVQPESQAASRGRNTMRALCEKESMGEQVIQLDRCKAALTIR